MTMAPLTLLSLVGASFLVLAMGEDVDTVPEPTYAVTLGNDGACLAEINAARLAVGLNELAQAEKDSETKFPETSIPSGGSYEEWVWKPVCDALIPEKTEKKTSRGGEKVEFHSGTYAYHPVENPDAIDCNAVVDKWRGAYKNFDGLPPPNKKDEALYQVQDNVSFVALYNPSEQATADCRVVTCTKTTPAEQNQQRTQAAGETEKGSALLCMTVPDVLPMNGTNTPFTEEQWKQIVTALEGSASAVSPGVVGIAVAIIGLGLL